tara:strand:- start:206 stop:1303 length:1098 start_codon:yes stop_codon:yes gene_type:complete
MNGSKIKILLISASGKTGGGPSHIFLLKELLKDEFDFYLAMPSFNSKNKILDNKKYLNISERKISLSDIIRLIIFSRKNSIDVIHAHGKGAGLIARIIKIFLNKPLIYTFHGIHTLCLSRLKKFLYISYENITGWLDDEKVFVSLSEKMQTIYSKIFIGKNNCIINNSTKEKLRIEFNHKKNNLNLGIDNNKKNIISICRLVDQKNIFEIFKIAKNLEIYNFIVLGDGYLFEKAKIYLKDNNIKNVYLVGNSIDVFKYLYESDLFLSTSLYEGHPISILEAMSIGLPVVASKVTGNIDTIKNGVSGFFYRLKDINQASYFIEKIMKNNELKLKFSFNSFSTHRKLFTTEKMKNSYISLYKKYNKY